MAKFYTPTRRGADYRFEAPHDINHLSSDTILTSTAHGWAAGFFSLRRIDRRDEFFVFPVTPQQLRITQPDRKQVYQTVGREGRMDHLGHGIGEITFVGHTGYKPVGPNAQTGIDGWLAFQQLRKIVDDYNMDRGRGINARLMLTISAPVDFGAWEVTAALNLDRTTARPLLFGYELHCTILRDVGGRREDGAIRLPPQVLGPHPFVLNALPPYRLDAHDKTSLQDQSPPAGAIQGESISLPAQKGQLEPFANEVVRGSYRLAPGEYIEWTFDPADEAHATIEAVANAAYGDRALDYIHLLLDASGIDPSRMHEVAAGTLLTIPLPPEFDSISGGQPGL